MEDWEEEKNKVRQLRNLVEEFDWTVEMPFCISRFNRFVLPTLFSIKTSFRKIHNLEETILCFWISRFYLWMFRCVDEQIETMIG